MPPIVTTNDTIICIHGGTVVLTPKQAVVTASGGAVLRETDLIGAPIVGCAQPPSISSKPCTTVVSTLPGGSRADGPCRRAAGTRVHAVGDHRRRPAGHHLGRGPGRADRSGVVTGPARG